jgi:glycerate kinase
MDKHTLATGVKIVVAMDSFKGSLSAGRACEIVAESIRSAVPDTQIIVKPMADGGEGTAQAMMAAGNGQWIEQTTMGPLPDMRVRVGFAWFADEKTAVVEMAAASGLELLEPGLRNPLKTTTFGTGQLIAAAVNHGAKRILLAVGGSATVDGGVGAATAMGWKFLDENRREISLGGGQLEAIERIIPPSQSIRVPVEVLCDVDNPLCGERGAARVYGPQKGATEEMVGLLEAGLAHLAELVREKLGRDIKDMPGAGAAGGLAAGAVAFMDAQLVSGIQTVMSHSHLHEALAQADWLITGEGQFDRQSLQGKVVSGVARAAKHTGTKVAVLAGQVLLEPHEYRSLGVREALACANDRMKLQDAIKNSEELLAKAARTFALRHLVG